MLKKIFQILLALLSGAGVFTLSRFLNTFFSIHIIVWGTIVLYYLSGAIIQLYFNSVRTRISFLIVTILMEVSVIINGPQFFYEAWIVLIMVCSFLAGYLVRYQRSIVLGALGGCIVLSLSYTLYFYPNHIFANPLLVDKTLEGRLWSSENTDVVLLNLDKQDVLLKSKIGKKPILLDFYFAACIPCLEKRKALEKLRKQLKDTIEIVLIDNGDIDSFETFTRGKDWDFTTLYDPKGRLAKNLKITSFPYEILIDSRGKIRRVELGYNKAIEEKYLESTNQQIKAMLHE